MTKRELEAGRLFPPTRFDSGWMVSAQADRAGYRCSPRARLDDLEDYETVEVVIRGPEFWPVDPARIGLRAEVVAKFTELAPLCGPSVGSYLTQDELHAVREAVRFAPMNPNAGVPRGTVGWRGRDVFHGAGSADAADIAANGIDMAASTGGYFGRGFYVAEAAALARSNYADFSDDGAGEVLRLTVGADALVLDLRNDADQRRWDESGLAASLHRDDFPRRARRAGIDGVYDRSVGGLAIYRAAALTFVGVEPSSRPPRGGAPAA